MISQEKEIAYDELEQKLLHVTKSEVPRLKSKLEEVRAQSFPPMPARTMDVGPIRPCRS